MVKVDLGKKYTLYSHLLIFVFVVMGIVLDLHNLNNDNKILSERNK